MTQTLQIKPGMKKQALLTILKSDGNISEGNHREGRVRLLNQQGKVVKADLITAVNGMRAGRLELTTAQASLLWHIATETSPNYNTFHAVTSQNAPIVGGLHDAGLSIEDANTYEQFYTN